MTMTPWTTAFKLMEREKILNSGWSEKRMTNLISCVYEAIQQFDGEIVFTDKSCADRVFILFRDSSIVEISRQSKDVFEIIAHDTKLHYEKQEVNTTEYITRNLSDDITKYDYYAFMHRKLKYWVDEANRMLNS